MARWSVRPASETLEKDWECLSEVLLDRSVLVLFVRDPAGCGCLDFLGEYLMLYGLSVISKSSLSGFRLGVCNYTIDKVISGVQCRHLRFVQAMFTYTIHTIHEA